ncbi:hypothetical protein J1N35_041449, partial [Gossypium stocksii]
LLMGEESSSDKVMAVVSDENELVEPAPKFKRGRVLSVQDFPPGCDRVAAPNFES